MTNQADYERVNRYCLRQLWGAFPTIEKPFIEAAVDRLTKYDNMTLERAANRIIETCTRRPSIADIINACESVIPQKSYAPNGKMPWEERLARVERRVKSYLVEFQQSDLGLQALREKWDFQLLRYAQAMAWVQAQMLESVPAIGWDGCVLLEGVPPDSRKGARDLFAEHIRPQCELAMQRGGVMVTVPSALLDRWRSEYGESSRRQR